MYHFLWDSPVLSLHAGLILGWRPAIGWCNPRINPASQHHNLTQVDPVPQQFKSMKQITKLDNIEKFMAIICANEIQNGFLKMIDCPWKELYLWKFNLRVWSSAQVTINSLRHKHASINYAIIGLDSGLSPVCSQAIIELILTYCQLNP